MSDFRPLCPPRPPPSLHDQLSRSQYQPAVAVRGDQQCNLGRQPDYFSSGFSQRRAGSGERDEHNNVLIELLRVLELSVSRSTSRAIVIILSNRLTTSPSRFSWSTQSLSIDHFPHDCETMTGNVKSMECECETQLVKFEIVTNYWAQIQSITKLTSDRKTSGSLRSGLNPELD